MSFDGHAARSSGCGIKPKVLGIGSAFVGRTDLSLHTGSYAMAHGFGSGVGVPRATRQLSPSQEVNLAGMTTAAPPSITDRLGGPCCFEERVP
jgi:hypothetical protein